MNNIGQVKGTLFNERNLGNRVTRITLANKDILTQTRGYLKERDYTEAKLIYRNGKYVMTVILDKVDHLGLVLGGFAKATPQEKKTIEGLYKVVLKEA